ncbi:MAG: hypothetical protein BM556_13305 [Bacteriovorax sp. MedPE-SWde]|nr:MAG: hypothetical protein BM556_13305 [Bacteriovorax sp. MedPE-SWde]
MSENNKTLKEVSLPLKVEELKEFIENKDNVYIADYSKIEIKGTVLYNYVSNLELPVEFDFSNCSFEEKEEAIKSFMETRNIVTADSLRINVAALILYIRGINVDEVFGNLIFTEDERKEFFKRNEGLCYRWEQFIESTMIFSQKCLKKKIEDSDDIPLNEIEFEHNFEIIDDVLYIGANVVKMFSIPSFMELFFLVQPRTELKYFKQQFDEYIFRGKNLFEFFFCDENEVFQMFAAHATGTVSMDELVKVGNYLETIPAP